MGNAGARIDRVKNLAGHYRENGRRKPRWATLVGVALLHLLAIAGLARAFAPDFTADAIRGAASLVTITVTEPEPEPEVLPPPEPSPEPEEGAAAEAGPQAVPRETAAPEPAIPIPSPSPAPPVASTGTEDAAGASEEGTGTGAGGEGDGLGSGLAGQGRGGISRRLELIAGTIDDASDYPRATRELRQGHDVVIELTVGTDGFVTACRVTDPSPDPAADAITCRLATQRFRFRPALDGAGNPIVGRYLWRQQWF